MINKFMALLCYISSIYYLWLACHRNPLWEDNWSGHSTVTIWFELAFLMFMIAQFFKAYLLPNQIIPKETKDMEKIALHYYETDLKMDLLALLPF